MAKIKNPSLFSDFFHIEAKLLTKLGVFDPTLNVDTRLFIDPLLLRQSQHPEISLGASSTYDQHFDKVIKFLKMSTTVHDVAWKSAARLLSFPEIKGTCLGYGTQSVSGSGSGNQMTAQYIATAKQIVELGIEDPDLFVAMALFEEGVGPDRISDMTTNVIFGDLLKFNERIFATIEIPRRKHKFVLRNGITYKATLPENPFFEKSEPVILVPTDVLRDLPIATDWSEIADAASQNAEVRMRTNSQIMDLWERKSRKDKAQIRDVILSGKNSFEDFLRTIKSVTPRSYDLESDPRGEVFWRRLLATLPKDEPLEITSPDVMNLKGAQSVVEQIIDQFRFLIEDRRLSEQLYHNNKPRPEKSAQMLFFAVAYSYCKANDLDLTPEAETGNGPVDFKFSGGFSDRVIVEIKLSTNTKIVDGYNKQLEAYKRGEETAKGYFIVIDVGLMGGKDQRLLHAKNAATAQGRGSFSNYFC